MAHDLPRTSPAEALLEAGLTPHLMATGSNGFHVVAPIEPVETFDTVAEVAWRFATVLAGRHRIA